MNDIRSKVYAQKVELPELLAKAEQSGLPEDTQKAKDFSALCLKNPSTDVFQRPFTRNFCIQVMEVRTELEQ